VTIRVAFLAANPGDTTRLRLDHEVRTIDERLREAKSTVRLELTSHWAVRVRDVADVMLRYRGLAGGDAKPRLWTRAGTGARPIRGDRWWQRRGLVGASVAAVAAAVAGVGLVIWDPFESPVLAGHNIELVLDASALRVDEKSAISVFAAAVTEVDRYVSGRDDFGLALRLIGGRCSGDPPDDPDVGFRTSNGERIRGAARARKPGGSSDLVDVEFHWIGYRVSDEQARIEIQTLASSTGSRAVFAETPGELSDALSRVSATAYGEDIQQLTGFVNEVNGHVEAAANAFVQAVNQRGMDRQAFEEASGAAADELDSASSALRRSRGPFYELNRSGAPSGYHELWDIDTSQRASQERQVSLLRRLLDQLQYGGRSPLEEGGEPKRLWDEFQATRGEYADRNDRFEKQAEAFLTSLA
jgi:hypothetical protein